MSKAATSKMNLSSYTALTNSNTLAQFVSQQNDKAPKRNTTKANLSFFKLRSPSRKKMSTSKSYAKGCRINESAKADLSFNGKHNRLESAYATEKPNLYKERLSSSKKVKKPKSDAISALTRISNALQKMKGNTSVYSTMQTHSSQQRYTSNRRFLNVTTVGNQKNLKKNETSTIKKEYSSDMEGSIDFNVPKRNTKGTLTTNHKQEIMKKLVNELKNAQRDLPSDEARRRKFKIINDAFSDVISLNDKFKGVLKQIQLNYKELYTELKEYYGSSNEDLKSKLKDLNHKFGKEKDNLNKELIKAAADLEKLKKVQEVKEADNKKLSEDISALHLENKNLKKIVKRLYEELKKYKEVLREIGFEEEDNRSELKENMPIMEIGKNKVKMPMLNFAALSPKKPGKLKVVQYCNSSQESNTEELNDSFNEEPSSNQDYIEGNALVLNVGDEYVVEALNTN